MSATQLAADRRWRCSGEGGDGPAGPPRPTCPGGRQQRAELAGGRATAGGQTPHKAPALMHSVPSLV